MNAGNRSPTRAGPHAPGVWRLVLELWAPWEFGAVLPAWPLLHRAPAGDGHAVPVFPGLSAGDTSTLPPRHYLQGLGHAPAGWGQGFNVGPRAGVLRHTRAMLRQMAARSGRRVSLVGWSVAGLVFPVPRRRTGGA